MSSAHEQPNAMVYALVVPVVAGAVAVISALDARVGLALVAAAIVALIMFVKSITVVDLLVISAPFMFFSSATSTLHVSASDFVLPVLVMGVVASKKFVGPEVRPVVNYAVGVFLLLAFSMLYGESLDSDFIIKLAAQNSLKMFVGLGYAIVVALWATNATLPEIVRSLRLWAWVATGLSIGSLLTAVGVAPLVPSDGTRSEGFFQDPNLYAGYLLLSAAVVLLVETLRPTRATPLQLVVISGGVLCTASRAAVVILLLLVAAALLFISSPKVRLTIGAVGGAAVALLVSIAHSGPTSYGIPALDRLYSSSQAQVAEADPRFGLWGRAIDLWEAHPFVGVGIGQFARFSVDVNGMAGDSGVGYIAHNSYLSFLAELGLPGFVLMVGGLVWLAVRTWRARGLATNVRRAMNLGLLVLAVQMLSLNLQNVRYLWIYVGIVLGLVAASRRTSSSDGQSLDDTSGEVPAAPRARAGHGGTLRRGGKDAQATSAGSPRRAASRSDVAASHFGRA